MMGLVDAATNRSWVYPMPGHTTTQVIDKLEEFLAQDIKGEWAYVLRSYPIQ
jgi:hypothetical protein